MFPSPLWGGVRGGGQEVQAQASTKAHHLSTPHPTLPHKGGGKEREDEPWPCFPAAAAWDAASSSPADWPPRPRCPRAASLRRRRRSKPPSASTCITTSCRRPTSRKSTSGSISATAPCRPINCCRGRRPSRWKSWTPTAFRPRSCRSLRPAPGSATSPPAAACRECGTTMPRSKSAIIPAATGCSP